ncbi:predicted protein [Nematostella vectensis]|uniref:Assembly chaperone of rpl4 n=1 Tax=Nematostella vectensis TaxID=45351 RepID=A7RY37_NEMVE|nr:probable assembly chaperone of rpl4 isoform X2 [Nematostella vectensis]EDO43571.1 predicted protein [Nematostella vectensis]|eukprot:XP_001635634.1 predicted protein [Nematostella vectensis]
MGGREKKKKKKASSSKKVASKHDDCDNKDVEREGEVPVSNNNTAIKQEHTMKDLLVKVEECMGAMNYELAEKFCERALEIDPDHVEAIEMAGSVFLETGQPEKAVNCFRRAIQLSPDEGYSKYMSIGQMLQGKEAAEVFTKGIQLMTSPQGGASLSVSPKDISAAYCSLAEIYLTDECFDDEAEIKCSEYCQKAIEADPTNPEAYQVMANCLLSRQKIEEGKKVLSKGLDLWLGKDDDLQEVPMPHFEARITTAKLLLELEDFEKAAQVLQTLLEENDEELEVWYLLGLMYHLSGQDPVNKKICLERAHKIWSEMESEDEALGAHIQEMLASTDEEDTMNNEDDDDEQMEVS